MTKKIENTVNQLTYNIIRIYELIYFRGKMCLESCVLRTTRFSNSPKDSVKLYSRDPTTNFNFFLVLHNFHGFKETHKKLPIWLKIA
jgi:hypothetical protein